MSERWETLQYWLYRASAFLAANVIEDPAFLALVFC